MPCGTALRTAPIDVELDCGGERPVIRVTNDGAAFDLNPRLPELDEERGRGIFIISELAGKPEVSCTETRCTVTVRLNLQIAAPPAEAPSPVAEIAEAIVEAVNGEPETNGAPAGGG
ncbi:MAG: ATP-binding protein [Candidatus Eremiobacteraeota bacterium]|nr:ATP-binding protein [Candidatus Eremiobacteraeota bacterium]